jgi:NADH:ubiquinone oxidoreductase subunit 2 (subunit N)
MMPYSNGDLFALLPVWILSIAAMVIMLVNVTRQKPSSSAFAILALIGIAGAACGAFELRDESRALFHDMYRLDAFSTFFTFLFLTIAAVGVLFSWDYLKRTNLNQGEFYALILLSTLGMIFMAAGNDLIMIFLGLELMSIALYILAGFRKNRFESNEAALKYFLLGAFASGFLLYGIALVYGATGSTNLAQIGGYLLGSPVVNTPLLMVGGLLVFIGLGFKVSLVPFHMWTPDAYEGAPTAATAFMSAGAKAAGFAGLLRVLMIALPSLAANWTAVMIGLCILTMTVGNVIAILQSNEAAARLLLDRPRRLRHARRDRGRYRRRGRGAVLPRGLHDHEPRRVRHRLADGQGRRRARARPGSRGRRFPPPLARHRDDGLHARPRRHPADCGLRRQALPVRRRFGQGHVLLVVVAVLNSVAAVYYYLRPVVASHDPARRRAARDLGRAACGACDQRVGGRDVLVRPRPALTGAAARRSWPRFLASCRSITGSFWLGLLSIAVVAVVAVTAISYFAAQALLHHRSARPSVTPADSGLIYQTVPLVARDGTKLEGWWIIPRDGVRRRDLATVVLAHAADGEIPGALTGKAGMLRQATWLSRAGFIVLAFDFRSYGGVRARARPRVVQQDLEAAIRLADDSPRWSADSS